MNEMHEVMQFKLVICTLLVFALAPTTYLFCGHCQSKNEAQVIPTQKRSEKRFQRVRISDSDLLERPVRRHNAKSVLLRGVSQVIGVGRNLSVADQELESALQRQGAGEVSWWLNGGADLDAKDISGQTHLHSAVLTSMLPYCSYPRRRLAKSVRLLLRRGIDLDARNYRGETPLSLVAAISSTVCRMGFYVEPGITEKLMRMFLEHGADIMHSGLRLCWNELF